VASYPTFGQLLGSEHEPFDDIQIDRAIDGTGYARAFFATTKHRFTLRHILTLAERDQLLAFYASNRTVPVDLVWQFDAATYTNLFIAGLPKFTPLRTNYVSAEVRLEPR
jgi:hypothetical protein